MRKYLAVGLLLLLIILYISPAGRLLTLENLHTYSSVIREGASGMPVISSLIFVVFYIIVVALSIPGATVMTLAGGLMFGPLLGTVLVNIGATLGAIGMFIAVRHFFGEYFQDRYKDRLKKINSELDKNGSYYLLTLRLVPLFPFFLVNIAAALSTVKLKRFAWTTSVGIIPGSFAYAYAGSQLTTIDSLSAILGPRIILAFALFGLLVLVPVIYKKVKKHAA